MGRESRAKYLKALELLRGWLIFHPLDQRFLTQEHENLRAETREFLKETTRNAMQVLQERRPSDVRPSE